MVEIDGIGEVAVMAYDRANGAPIWRTDLHTDGLDGKLHERNSYATATPAWNGEALFVPCFVGGKVVVSRVNADGEIAWQQPVMDFKSLWGYSVSPVLHGDLVGCAAIVVGSPRVNDQVIIKIPRNPNACAEVCRGGVIRVLHDGEAIIAQARIGSGHDGSRGR